MDTQLPFLSIILEIFFPWCLSQFFVNTTSPTLSKSIVFTSSSRHPLKIRLHILVPSFLLLSKQSQTCDYDKLFLLYYDLHSKLSNSTAWHSFHSHLPVISRQRSVSTAVNIFTVLSLISELFTTVLHIRINLNIFVSYEYIEIMCSCGMQTAAIERYRTYVKTYVPISSLQCTQHLTP